MISLRTGDTQVSNRTHFGGVDDTILPLAVPLLGEESGKRHSWGTGCGRANRRKRPL